MDLTPAYEITVKLRGHQKDEPSKKRNAFSGIYLITNILRHLYGCFVT